MSKVKLNQPAPDFSLTSHTGEKFVLSEMRGKKNLLLVFNRGFT